METLTQAQPEVKIVGKIDLAKFEKKKIKVETKEIEPEIISEKISIKKVEQKIKEKMIIHFFKDKNQKIIGRSEDGKIAIIDFNYPDIIKENEDWEVSIEDDQEKKMIVRPIRLAISAEQNNAQFMEKVQSLNNKEWNKATTKRINVFGKRYDIRKKSGF